MPKNTDKHWEMKRVNLQQDNEKTLKAILNNKISGEINLSVEKLHGIKSDDDFTVASNQHKPKLERISENIPAVLLEFEIYEDGSHECIYSSPSIERIFGIKSSGYLKITQFVHPDDIEALVAIIEKSSQTNDSFYVESRMILPAKGIIWRSFSATFSYNTINKSKIYSAVMQDISDRKISDNKLNESESKLVSLITNLQTGIMVEDEFNHITLTNELFCEMFDFDLSPDELKGKDCSGFAEEKKHLFKDPEYYVEKRLSTLEFQKPVMNDILEMKDGKILRRDYIPFSNDDNFKGHLWKFTDVTAEKNAENTLQIREQKYRSIIDNMNLGLLEVDSAENIIFANQCFCEMCGYQLEEILGKRAAQIFAKGENIELMERKNEASRKGSSNAYEIVVKNKRGQVRWWLVSGAPRYNDNGELVGSIGIHLDITAQKQLELELTISREQAEQSTRSKELFLANMSHEIRTPMNAILGMSNQLAKTPLDKKQTFYLDTISSASENLLVIINDILDLSKIEAGKLSLEKIAFEPKEVIKRAMQVLSHKAEEKGLSLTNSIFDSSLSSVFIGDPYRINQILLNIISNAIKFTEKGSVDLLFEMITETVSNQTVRITVKDTGIGMDADFKKSLFEKFTQEEASVTRQYGGTGLGMSICKELIELMNGEINVESEKGVGTAISFIITFPKGIAENLPSKESFVANEAMLKGKTILVVDDNEINRLVATTILVNYGAETVEASNGKESIEFLANNKVDLVLMDVQMPVMNGFEAAKHIRFNIDSALPIIALTANAIKGDNLKCITAGMNDYLAKPFKEEDLLKMISGILKIEGTTEVHQPATEINTAPEPANYDISEIITISRGNDGFVKKMLKMFVEQVPAQVSEMKIKYQEAEFIIVGELAHRIKPTIDNMGIIASKACIREIEKIGKTGKDNGSLKELIQKLEKDINNAVESIKKDYEL